MSRPMYFGMSVCFASSFFCNTAARVARMQYAYAAVGSRSSLLLMPPSASSEHIRSNLVVKRTTRVSNSGGGVHNLSNQRRICQYFNRSVAALLLGAESGREENKDGRVDSSTIFELSLAMVIRRSKASSLVRVNVSQVMIENNS